jgi:prepilin-type N-terminal cleavage/methylation domain-containing protein
MSARTRPVKARRARRPGFSLIEILVVLAIFALAAAVIMPSTSRMLDQATAHAVFFEFQRQVSDLRREANRTGEAIRLIDPAATPGEGERTAILREPWRYTLAPSLDIAPGGSCSATTANLLKGDQVIMTLRAQDADCRFIRQATTAARPPAPSPR